jgi:hypothetical protein
MQLDNHNPSMSESTKIEIAHALLKKQLVQKDHDLIMVTKNALGTQESIIKSTDSPESKAKHHVLWFPQSVQVRPWSCCRNPPYDHRSILWDQKTLVGIFCTAKNTSQRTTSK